jgi:hypothetical protein
VAFPGEVYKLAIARRNSADPSIIAARAKIHKRDFTEKLSILPDDSCGLCYQEGVMKKRLDYDVVVKDMFHHDRPMPLRQITRGARIRQFLNPELPAVFKRVADLMMLLSSGEILHVDFQTTNDRSMAYRVGVYGLLAAWKFKRRVRHVVIYLGARRLTMSPRVEAGDVTVNYQLIDIREMEVDALLATGNPADCALALLARDGPARLREIVERAARLPEEDRQRALAQMAVLSGLRRVSEALTMEVRAMGLTVDIEKNAFLRDIRDAAILQGRQEGLEAGREEGREEGLEAGREEGLEAGREAGVLQGTAKTLERLLETKFGPLPKWAKTRLSEATASQLDRWTIKVLAAATLEEAIGRR